MARLKEAQANKEKAVGYGASATEGPEVAPAATVGATTTLEDLERQKEILAKLSHRAKDSHKRPTLCKTKIHLGRLFNLVEAAGGAEKLDRPVMWNPLADDLVGHISKDKERGRRLQQIYLDTIKRLEETASISVGGAVAAAGEQEPLPAVNGSGSEAQLETGVGQEQDTGAADLGEIATIVLAEESPGVGTGTETQQRVVTATPRRLSKRQPQPKSLGEDFLPTDKSPSSVRSSARKKAKVQ